MRTSARLKAPPALTAALTASLVVSLAACTPASPPTPTASPPTPAAPPPTAAAPTAPPPTPAPPTATPAPPRPSPTPDPRPAIGTPAWLDGALIYQIFPRSFRDSNGDGIGDLNGVREKLDYIQSLGANAIWFNPFYPSTTYHGYDVVDYTAVNPQLGTLDDFKALAAEMKRRGMRLIVDYVANHASSGHPFFKDAYKNPTSKYTRWFNFFDAGNTSYASFAGVANLPDWNTDNPEVVKYLIDAALFWLDLGADGLRCDYSLGLEEPFWKQLRAAVKARHPDAVILAETWDQNALTLNKYFGYGVDAQFDFPFALNLAGNIDRNGDGVLNGAQPAASLQAPLRLLQRLYPRDAQVVRFVSNHDTNRIASEVDGDPARERLAAAAGLLLPGTPIVYYGEEIGMRGTKGPGPVYDESGTQTPPAGAGAGVKPIAVVYDELRREPMDWYSSEAGPGMATWFKPAYRNNKPGDGISVEEQDKDPASLLNYYRGLAKLRAAHPALRGRDFAVIDKVEGCETACLGVWRWGKDDAVLVVLNFSGQAQTVVLDAAGAPVALSGSPANVLGGGAQLAPWGVGVMRWGR